MIDIAIVTTAIPPRKTARRDSDDTQAETRTGSIWIRRGDKIRRKTIESVTAAGIRLELMAFFERYLGKNIRVQVVVPQHGDASVVAAVRTLLDVCEFVAPHGYSHFKRTRPKHVKPDFSPFTYGALGVEHRNFKPHWYVEPEGPILLKSSSGAGFTYPATEAEEDDDQFDRDDAESFHENVSDPTLRAIYTDEAQAKSQKTKPSGSAGFRLLAKAIR